MGQQVLIVEPRDIVRIGLKTIFVEDPRVSKVHEATTDEAFRTHLHSHPVDLVVIHQTVVTDIATLSKSNFVIVTNQPDMHLLLAAYAHGSRGYLSESISADLLRTMLYPTKGAFLLDPILTPWIMEYLSSNKLSSTEDELLTQREREIVSLLHSGLDKHTLAKQLHISELTLKTHIKNIARKRRIEQHSEIRISS